jgi:hypothetical protein
VPPPERARVDVPEQLVPTIGELARAIEALAEDPESPDTRRRASSAARETAREAVHGEDLGAPDPHTTLAVEGIRLAASDVMRLSRRSRKHTTAAVTGLASTLSGLSLSRQDSDGATTIGSGVTQVWSSEKYPLLKER